jgi:diguanylate cyclase (GGDEF)-like protein/PAS domain S-box-containing protein
VKPEHKYLLSIEHYPEGIALFREELSTDGKLKDFILIEVNEPWERLTGLSQKQVIGKKASDILSEIDFPVENWISLCEKAWLNKTYLRFEHFFRTIDRWFEITSFYDQSNVLVCIFREITDLDKEHDLMSPTIIEKDVKDLKLTDIIDKPALQSLINDFYNLTKIRISLLDIEGKVLVSTGDEEICRRFHHKHPKTAMHCQESNTQLTRDISEGTFKAYKCRNNLWDIATPVVIEGKTLGNLFLGQFFYDDEPINYEFFRVQARQYGFDEQEYIVCLDLVPRYSRDIVQSALTFISNLAKMISAMGFSSIKLTRSLEERNRYLREMRESRERLTATLHSIGDGVISTDKNGFITSLNPMAEKITGWEANEAKGKMINEVFSLRDEKSNISYNYQITGVLNGKGIHNFANSILLIDRKGIVKPIDGSIAPIQDQYDKRIGAVIVFRDQSVNRAITWDLRIMKSAIESSINAIVMADLNGLISYVNSAALRLWGYEKKEEVLGRAVKHLWSEDFEKFQIMNNLRRKGAYFGELAGRKKDGSFFDVQISAALVTNEDDQPVCFMGSFVDITEQKQAEKTLAEEAIRRRILIEQSRDGIVVMDQEGGVFEANQRFADMLGYTIDEIYRLHVWEWDALFTREQLLSQTQLVSEAGDHFETKHRRKDGSIINVEISSNAAVFDGKKLIFCVCHDITHRKKMEEELRRERTLLRTLIDNLPDAVYVKDRETRKLLANPADLENMGLKREEEVLGKTDFEVFPQEVAKQFYKDDMFVLNNRKSIINREERLVRPSGEERFLLSSKIPLFDEKGEAIGLIGIGHDITEQRKANERVNYLSFHDSLTGLYNRVYLEEEIKRLDTDRQLPIGIIMVDINRLKLINDAYGHPMGDQLLKTSSSVLKDVCRKEDIIARWGGDEFVIFLPKTSVKEIDAIKKRIIEQCKKTQVCSIPLSMAIGFSVKTRADQDIMKIFKEAEDNMYQNKLIESRSSRNTFLLTLKSALQKKNDISDEHIAYLQNLAQIFGETVNLTGTDLDCFVLLVTFHDIGNIASPDELLNKTSPLTKEEQSIIQRHSEIGYRIARNIDELSGIAYAILSQHENWDGSGYPQGLKGEEIPLLSRLNAIITAYDTMTRKNKFNQRGGVCPKARALKELKRCAGKQFDPESVNLFIEMINNLPE